MRFTFRKLWSALTENTGTGPKVKHDSNGWPDPSAQTRREQAGALQSSIGQKRLLKNIELTPCTWSTCMEVEAVHRALSQLAIEHPDAESSGHCHWLSSPKYGQVGYLIDGFPQA